MKNHWSIKLAALLLVAVSGFTLTISGLSVFLNWNWGLYWHGPGEVSENYRQERLEDWGFNEAMCLAAVHLMEQNTTLGSVESELWQNCFNSGWNWESSSECAYSIKVNGVQTDSWMPDGEYPESVTFRLSLETGKVVCLGGTGNYPTYDQVTPDYVWQTPTGAPLEAPDARTLSYDFYMWYDGNYYRVDRYQNVNCQVTLYLTEAQVQNITDYGSRGALQEVTYSQRQYDYLVALGSLVVLALAVLHLCFAAGKKPDSDVIRPRGTNALPLDLFAVGAALGVTLLVVLADQGMYYASDADSAGLVWLYLAGAGAAGSCGVLLCTLFLTALCAQARLGKWQWLKRTVAGRIVCGILGWFGAGARKVAGHTERLGLVRKADIVIRSAYRNLPLNWQWLALYGGLCLIAAAMSWFAFRFGGYLMGTIMILAIGTPVVIYTAHCFGRLRDAARRMSQGDLDTKIDTYQEILHGSFGEFAEDLNALGDACTMAAQEKMKSERMKSELITNVSHDIKTPLTSIINYVDLLQRAQTEEQRREYLEVLDRQSQRLKKLIEDLMEMSKANSGNIPVELQSTDVIEAVSQALGEYSDALSARDLTVVFRPAGPLMASCDGKLLWRVMSNLLGNVVKYALPGTRVYCDVTADGRKVRVSVKNISRDPLNITADELMERFVRGDQSRNSEGNGLGLNIAKSLMEVQNGELELTVDGDLFKATLILNQT